MKISIALTALASLAAVEAFQPLPAAHSSVARSLSKPAPTTTTALAAFGRPNQQKEVVLEPNYNIALSLAAAAPIVLGLYSRKLVPLYIVHAYSIPRISLAARFLNDFPGIRNVGYSPVLEC